MADSFKIELGVELEQGSLASVQSQINNIQPNPIQLQMNTTNVQNQLNNIRQQIQALGNITINLGGGNNRGIGNQVSALQRAYRELYNMSKQISSMELKVGKLNISGINAGQIATYTQQLNTLRTTYQTLLASLGGTNVNLDSVFTQIDRSKTQISELSSVVDNARTKLASSIKIDIDNGNLGNQIAAIEQKFNSLGIANTNVTNGITQLRTLLSSMDATDNIESVTNDYRDFKQTLETVTNQVNELQRTQRNNINNMNLNNQRTVLSSRIDVWLQNNTAAARSFGSQITALKAQIQSADSVQLNNLKAQFQELKREAELTGNTGMTVMDKLKSQFGKLGIYLSASAILGKEVQALKSMLDNVIEVDTAMTELYRVTNLSDTQYSNMFNNMIQSAKNYGMQLDTIIKSTASWVRLGFDTKDAGRLAEITAMYQHVTDLDEKTAVENLVTAYKGYQNQLLNLTNGDVTAAVEMIADIFDKLGNELPVTAEQVGAGLTKCASVMESAGATIEEASGMIVGGGSVTQDFEAMGNALKISTLRIHGMKGELQVLNEDVDENVESVSKMQTQILNLTHGKVNIFEDDGETFRNIYDIYNDIAEILPKLSGIESADLIETIAGKNRANQIQSMLNNWKEIKKAVEAANNAEGTAAKENEIYMDSIQGRLDTLSATWQAFSNTFIDSSFVKGIISGTTSIIDILDKFVSSFGTLKTIGAGVIISKIIKDVA